MSRHPPIIAVIDDEQAVCKALGRLLQSAGWEVEIFRGGGEFLASLAGHHPDCALLDLTMPDVSGFDVLQRLAETGSLIPVIVITGNDSATAEECVMRGGAVACLRKPVNDRVLLDAITAAIARSAANPPP